MKSYMTSDSHLARFCRKLRGHPLSVFWLFNCGAFAAGITGTISALVTLGALLMTQMAIITHVVNHTHDPNRKPNERGQN